MMNLSPVQLIEINGLLKKVVMDGVIMNCSTIQILILQHLLEMVN